MSDQWNFLQDSPLTSEGGKDEIYYNATDRNLNTLKNNKSKIGLWGYFTSLLTNLSIGQNGRKMQT